MTEHGGMLDRTWAQALDRAAEVWSSRPAFHFAGPHWEQSLTYAAWLEQSRLVASALAHLGVGHGDRVAMLAPGCAAWPIVQTATSALGAIVVPINIRYRRDELTHVLGASDPKIVITVAKYHETNYAELIRDASIAASVSPQLVLIDHREHDFTSAGVTDDPAGDASSWSHLLASGAGTPVPDRGADAADAVLMQFTSGTTAFPKAALLSSRATLGATWHLAQRIGVTESDVYFSTQPMYHVGGSVASILLPLVSGAAVVVPERYSPEEVFRLIPKYRCTIRTGQAAMYAMELAHPDFRPEFFTTLRAGWGGGAPELKRAIRDRMGIQNLTAIYGLTETAGTTTITDKSDPEDTWMRSCGRAIPGLEVGVLVDGAVLTLPNQVGEICIRGWSVMLGYYRDPAATAEAIDDAGWFHTGDLGTLDEDGNLFFIDRLKDMIKPGGENVSALEVERVIAEVEGVAQVAVVGRPDARLGEVPVAFVEMHDGAAFSPDEIIAHCRASIASFKVPRSVVQVAEWPMTESGKILKRHLVAQLADQAEAKGYVGGSG